MNRKLPSYLLGKYQLMGTVTFSVLFAIIFLNISVPFSETAWFGFGDANIFKNTLVFGISAILTLVVSRVLMYRSKSLFEMTYAGYIIWCIAEITVIASIYSGLTKGLQILSEAEIIIFLRGLKNGCIALGIPYLIAGMYFAINDKNKTIRLMNYDNVVTDEEDVDAEKPRKKVTLFDNNGSLKLSLNIESLYYIESDDNYIKVWYSDSKGDLKQYILRCRLKTVEESFKGSSLVRCNRKYIVNIDKVKILRKESEAYILDLDNEAIPPLPVTKTYTVPVLAHFAEQRPLMDPIE